MQMKYTMGKEKNATVETWGNEPKCGLPKKRNPRNPPPTTKSTFAQPETKKRNPPLMATFLKNNP